MADVTGPISTLPGSRHAPPDGEMCDDHPDRIATHRVQGETDSFGSEMHDMCKECFDRHLEEEREYREEARRGMCDWCKKEATDLRDRRDFEEGMYGRVYRVCGACVKAENERLQEELEESGYYDDWGYD